MALPEDGYGWEKLFSERMCRHFREDFGLGTRIARYHNVYGPRGTYDGGREKGPAAICRKVIEAKLAGNHGIEIWGDGNQTRSFMYIDDCVQGTRMIMDSDFADQATEACPECSLNQFRCTSTGLTTSFGDSQFCSSFRRSPRTSASGSKIGKFQ